MKIAIQKKISIVYKELNRIIYLKRLLRNRFLPREKLRQIQFKKFKKLIIHAYKNVPFYHEKYKQAEINPYSIMTEKDILKIPILTKEEVRANFPDRILAKGVDIKKCVINGTSGSTSKPLKYAINYQNQAVRDAVHEYVNIIAGCRKKYSLIHLISLHGDNQNKIEGKNKRFRVSPYADLKFHIKMFDKIKPDFILACPSFLIVLGLHLGKANYTFKKPVKGIITTGELVTQIIKQRLEKSFKTRVFDSYGCGETVDVACECTVHNGMHEIMEHAYVEIIKNNRPAKEMEP